MNRLLRGGGGGTVVIDDNDDDDDDGATELSRARYTHDGTQARLRAVLDGADAATRHLYGHASVARPAPRGVAWRKVALAVPRAVAIAALSLVALAVLDVERNFAMRVAWIVTWPPVAVVASVRAARRLARLGNAGAVPLRDIVDVWLALALLYANTLLALELATSCETPAANCENCTPWNYDDTQVANEDDDALPRSAFALLDAPRASALAAWLRLVNAALGASVAAPARRIVARTPLAALALLGLDVSAFAFRLVASARVVVRFLSGR